MKDILMKIKILVTLTVIFNSILFISDVSAENLQYKWKDANGEVHYTERPPANGVPFETIRIKSHVSNQPASSLTKNDKAAEQKPEDIQDKKYNDWKKENCKRAMQNLDVLENAGRISQDDGQGGTRLMTDEEKQEKIKAMTEQKEKYCSENAE